MLLKFISDVVFSLRSGVNLTGFSTHLLSTMPSSYPYDGNKKGVRGPESQVTALGPSCWALNSQGCAPPQNAKLCPITFLIMPDPPSRSDTWYNPLPYRWKYVCWPWLGCSAGSLGHYWEGTAHNHFSPSFSLHSHLCK